MKSLDKKIIYLLFTIGVLLSILLVGSSAYYFLNRDKNKVADFENPIVEQAVLKPLEERLPFVINRNSSLYNSLRAQGVDGATIAEIVRVSKPIYDLGRIRPGIRYNLEHIEDEGAKTLNKITFRFSPVQKLEVKRLNGEWLAKEIIKDVEVKTVTFSGVVVTSLWESAQASNMDPILISGLAEIFAWEIDFAREVRINDRWRITVERKLVNGEPIGWGSILVAEYDNAGDPHTAILFRHDGKDLGYFKPDGSSLRRMFLKSPIEFARISSRFNRNRFHPVLKVNRPHLGVDYAAPTGTPIRSVGSGRITFAGWTNGGGNTIRIRHNETYSTAYMHMSRFARGIRNGARVEQGQVIGYVGQTGLATGPHLHFEFYVNGRYVDPLRQSFPSADPVPKELMADFSKQAQELIAILPPWEDINVRGFASEETKPSEISL